MKAMILAAGLGTRLRPLTDKTPKALIKIEGRTLLERALSHLKANGISQVIINVHHLAGQIIKYLDTNNNFGMKITISDESDELLDTGGGLDNASWFFNDQQPFVVRNVDVLSDLNLVKMAEFHRQNNALATLAVRDRETSRYLLFGKTDNLLCGWENEKTGEKIIVRKDEQDPVHLAFSGIHVLEPAVFSLITLAGKYSLTKMYLSLAKDNRIIAYRENDSYWEDAGKLIK